MEFSPTSAVPGEETTLKVKALPNSLCGVSAVDQSVLVKEPGKTLTPSQVTVAPHVTKGVGAHSDHPQAHARHAGQRELQLLFSFPDLSTVAGEQSLQCPARS